MDDFILNSRLGHQSTQVVTHFAHLILKRLQLLVARNEAELGLEVWQSLSTSQLITEKEGQALAKAGEPGSQAWLLDRLAESLDHRVNRRTDRQVVIVTPLVTFFWGAIVILAAQVVLFSIASIITSLS